MNWFDYIVKHAKVLRNVCAFVFVCCICVIIGMAMKGQGHTNTIKHESSNYQCKFVDVQDYDNYRVVYNQANRVMYIIGDNGSATVMIDDNGEPMTWLGV